MSRNRCERQVRKTTFGLLDQMLASATAALPEAKRVSQTLQMRAAFDNIIKGRTPSVDDWRTLSDAINLTETLCSLGLCADTSGLLTDAVAAMVRLATRHQNGQPMRLDAAGIEAVCATLESYEIAIESITEREWVKCHRITEQRIHAIQQGRRRSHDVQIVTI
jgi:hypothetical protein